MAQTVGDFLLTRLGEWGVTRIYGYPGDGINGILGALERAQDRMRFIQVRHEEMAAFMACAHAKFTGEVGVCLATSGPGAIHLLNGLYDAKMDHQPVVAIVGQSARAAIGGNYPAGSRSAVALQGCRARIRPDGDGARAGPAPGRSRRAHRPVAADRHLHHHSRTTSRSSTRAEPPRTHGTVHSGIGYSQPARRPAATPICAARPTSSTPERRSPCWWAPARCRRPTR